MVSAFNGHSQIVQLLLASGADPNLQLSSGITALIAACHAANCLGSVELLVMSGADLSIVGSIGLTALDVAADRGHK